MEKICRFCLKVSIKNTCSLQECDILYNIQRFLKLDIPTDDFFPNNLCKECFKKVSQLIKFCLTLQDNEAELQKYAKNGLLENYYAIILENAKIENEQTKCKPEHKTLIKMKEETGSDNEDYDHLKNEESSDDFNETRYSSEDESASSKQLLVTPVPSIAKKKLKTLVNTVEDSKIISKFKPVKGLENFKRKRKADPVVFEYVKQFTCLTCLEQCENQADLAKHYYAEHFSQETGIILENAKIENEQTKCKPEHITLIKMKEETGSDNEDYDHLKNEESSDDFNETRYSSEDESASSKQLLVTPVPSMAKKKLKTLVNTVEDSKIISKFKPVKGLENFKRKRKPDPVVFEYVKQFTCLTCLEQCENQADLAKHYYAEHFSQQTVRKKYTEQKSGDKTLYTCNICKETCDLKKDIVKHVMIHSDDRPLTCKICARTYRTVPDIVRHARAHNGIKLQCPYNCGFSTAYQGAMKEHTSKHLDEYKYTCEKCGKGFNTKTWFDQHHNIHTGDKPYICDICGMAFPMTRYLQTHKASAHPQSSNLKRYRCVHCGEQCDSANSLAIHMQDHGIKQDKNILCDFCGKILATDYQLQYHYRMHLGVKPYSCSICKKKFAKKYNVQLHMTIHSGDKSHACSRCGKLYSQRATLLRHLKRYHPGTSSENTGET